MPELERLAAAAAIPVLLRVIIYMQEKAIRGEPLIPEPLGPGDVTTVRNLIIEAGDIVSAWGQELAEKDGKAWKAREIPRLPGVEIQIRLVTTLGEEELGHPFLSIMITNNNKLLDLRLPAEPSAVKDAQSVRRILEDGQHQKIDGQSKTVLMPDLRETLTLLRSIRSRP